ncbi:MAG: tRNA uridine-5-carboxymethylaminomethyl(34) synthesis GTPase MnmE [Candidatus Eisenbacteria bacterium]
MNDTIAAISTPPGRSALAIVRLSGADAVAIADRVFRAWGTATDPLAETPARTLRHGSAHDASGETIDELVAVVLLAPASYTGETMVEFTCHGGDWSAPRLLAALLAAGARAARAGEFTERAFLNGRIDLARAEAVADVIHAESELAHRLAARQVAGALSTGLSNVAEPLRDLLAEVEARVDFAEDVGESALPKHIGDGLARASEALHQLLRGADLGRRAREGARLALVGRPNVGKSSLFNALLGESRALVAAVAGTTRDAVSERLDVGGIPVRLVDTAGLREPDTGQLVEQLGIARTRVEVEGADAALLVLDASEAWSAADAGARALIGDRPFVVALNKRDLPRAMVLPTAQAGATCIEVSALTGEGVPQLREALAAALASCSEGDPSAALVTNVRHIDALRRARIAIDEAHGAAASAPGEIVAGEIRVALAALGEITGEAVAPDLLARIFARFCIGK